MRDYTNLYCRVKYSPSKCWQQVTLKPDDFCELIEYLTALETTMKQCGLGCYLPTLRAVIPDTIGMNTNATNTRTPTVNS